MLRLAILAILLGGCRNDRDHDAGAVPVTQPASAVSAGEPLPKLPQSADGAEELRGLDTRIDRVRDKPAELATLIALLRERAAYSGRLEDFVDALALSKSLVEQSPADPAAWRQRFDALLAVHEFAAAREVLPHTPAKDHPELAAALAEATGDLLTALAFRKRRATEWPRLENIARHGATLAAAGKLDEALAEMRRAAAAVRDNPPQLFAWFLFQYGRVLELRGDFSSARRFYEASRARMETLEATSHLVEILRSTGDRAGADAIAKTSTHPELTGDWDSYVTALPKAFSDHAARFYLAAGDGARALALAQADRANRDTHVSRALVVEAALAAKDPKLACEVAPALAADPQRDGRFLAWRAFSTCGRTADAATLAAELGI